MPQVSRANPRQEDRESKEVRKAIDKEQKRNRGVMSCAECRRLKLKCDKTVPCSSCKRRGCSAICPNGCLTTGQGTRFVLADTEKLHQKIALMSDRIRQLEDALAVLQSTVAPGETHPLLDRELLELKSIIELHAAIDEGKIQKTKSNNDDVEEDPHYIEAFGTLALRDDGAATFYGPSAGSESLLIGESAESSSQPIPPPSSQPSPHDLPASIKHLSSTFPLAPVFSYSVDLDYLVQNHLPPWRRARQLSEFYMSQAPWFFGAVTKQQLLEECLPLWYNEASDLIVPGSIAPPTEPNPSGGSLESQSKTAHKLALLFAIFCFGALTDDSLPSAPDNEEADMYLHLTRAALNLEPVLDRPPSVTTVQTLALLAIYQGLCSGENSIESTWGIFGLAIRLAQSIGLHRDCARWQLTSSEVQKRRALFWELFITDGWQSLATGRLATFYLPFVDCELPNDSDPTIDDDGSVLPSFPAWKARFGYECMSAVIQNVQTAKVPKYSAIIELDRKVRDMELPKYALRVPPPEAGLAETMKYYMPLNYRHIILIYIHRCFFAEAVSNNPTDPMKSPYAPSFLAGYRSACELLSSLRTQFNLFPAQIARFWVLWTHAFSSSVMLASVVTHASGTGIRSKTTGAALTELRRAVDLFKDAGARGGRAVKFLPILQRLLQKAEKAYSTATPSVVRKKDIFSLSSTEPTPKDELSIFSGQINKVAIKAPSSSPSPVSNGPTSQSPSVPQAVPEDDLMAGFTSLHPTLRDHWTNFDDDINTQLSNAQRDDYYTDADMVSTESSPPPQAQPTQRPQLFPISVSHPNTAYAENSPTSLTSSPSYQENVRYNAPMEYQSPPQLQPLEEHSYRNEPSYVSSHQQPLQFHHYQPKVHQSSPPKTQSQRQGHPYHQPPDTSTRYDHYSQHTFRPPPREQREVQHQDRHQSHTEPSHHYATTPSSQTRYSTPTNYYQYTDYTEPSPAQLQNWGEGPQGYQESPMIAQPLDQYPQSHHYGYVTEHARIPEPPFQQQQHHLQETWQSFGVYVSFPRPTA